MKILFGGSGFNFVATLISVNIDIASVIKNFSLTNV